MYGVRVCNRLLPTVRAQTRVDFDFSSVGDIIESCFFLQVRLFAFFHLGKAFQSRNQGIFSGFMAIDVRTAKENCAIMREWYP